MNGSAIRMMDCIREPCFKSRVQIISSVFEKNTAYQGGAIYAEDYHLRIRNSTFLQNTAVINGGAISVKKPKMKLVIRKSIFEGNNVTWDVRDLNLTSLYHYQDYVPQKMDSLGGAICALNPEKIIISKSTFQFNCAPGGGAVSVRNAQREEGWKKVVVFNVFDSTFRNNSILKCRGEHMAVDILEPLNGTGGAISHVVEGDLPLLEWTIQGSHFVNNTAVSGGGLFISGAPATDRNITNCTFNRNTVLVAGGSILAWNANVVLSSTNISESMARGGGGMMLWHQSSLTIQEDPEDPSKRSVISNNTAWYGGGIFLYELGRKIPSQLPKNRCAMRLSL